MNRTRALPVKIGVGIVIGFAMIGLVSIIRNNPDKPASEQSQISHPVGETTQLAKVSPVRNSKPVSEAVTTSHAGETTELSREEREEVIAFLDELGKAEEKPDDEKPLTYQEEIRQRYVRIRKTPEYQALLVESRKLNAEMESAFTPEWFTRECGAFYRNMYSVLGMTYEEGTEKRRRGEIPQKDLDYMREVRQQYVAKIKEYNDRRQAIREKGVILRAKMLALLGMTEREFEIAVNWGIKPPPRPKNR